MAKSSSASASDARQFHVLEFDRREEAAAFLAAESASRGHRLIIKGGETPAWGLAEAELQLSQAVR